MLLVTADGVVPDEVELRVALESALAVGESVATAVMLPLDDEACATGMTGVDTAAEL